MTAAGRRWLCERIATDTRPIAHVAAEMGSSRTTAVRWWARYQAEWVEGLLDRPSVPWHSPRRLARRLEHRIAQLRRTRKRGPARIGAVLGLAASPVHRVLVRLGLNRLRWLDRPTGRVIRRYEHAAPGELLHVDVKKLGRIPQGGGQRALGRGLGGRHRRADRRAGAMSSCTRRWTITPGWPTPRS